MAKRPKMSAGEMEVARAVWKLGEAAVGRVHELMVQRKAIDYTTVQTYLRRLEAKGYLRTRRQGRHKIYRPWIGAGQVIRETVDDLVDRLFDGDAFSLWQHLIRDRGISAAETRELRELLDKWEEDRDAG